MAAISKQDLVAPRTAADIESKYNFGKSFAEVMGIATDARDTATEAKKVAETIDTKLTPDEIFNLLTNNGEVQGIFRDDDGQIYINAEYIVSLSAMFAKDITMTGKFTNTASIYIAPSNTEIDVITNHIGGKVTIPTSLIPLYDFDNDGAVTMADLSRALAYKNGSMPIASWSGAIPSNVTMTIDMSNLDKVIHMTGKDMWGKEIDSYIGINFTSTKNPETERRLKALEDKGDQYPVGSVYVSTTNTNPSSKFGGTWELIDKEFSELVASDSSGKYFVPVSSGTSSYTLYIIRSGKTIDFRLNFYNAMELTDTAVNIGVFNFNALGIDSLYYGAVYEPGGTDGGNAIPLFNVQWETGTVSVEDVICKGSTTGIPTGNSVYYRGRLQCNSDRMLDSACDKFYWKRTA